MVNIYRSRPVEILAVKFESNNIDEVTKFICAVDQQHYMGVFYIGEDGIVRNEEFKGKNDKMCIKIKTLEENAFVTVGNYIVRGINNELYQVDSKIFEHKYEKIS